MGWISNVFGSAEVSADTVKKATDGIYNGVDKAIYTAEEQDDSYLEREKTRLEIAKVAYDQNGPRNVTRRWLAWSITGWVLGNAQLAIILSILGKKEAVQSIIDIAIAFQIGWAFVSVVSFFFVVQLPRALRK